MPPRVFMETALSSESLVSLEGSTVALSSLKPPMDGADGEIIVRMYETAGYTCSARLEMDGCVEAWHSDITEVKGAELLCAGGGGLICSCSLLRSKRCVLQGFSASVMSSGELLDYEIGLSSPDTRMVLVSQSGESAEKR